MTLLDLLIAMSIVTLAGVVVVGMLVTAKRTWIASATHVAVAQDLHVALSRVTADLRDGGIDTLTDNTAGTPVAFSVLSAKDSTGSFVTGDDGVPVSQKFVIYYIPPGTRKLLRKEVAGAFTTALSTADLVTACADGQGSVCASTVTSLRLVPDTTGGSVVLSLTCEATNGSGRLEQQSCSVTIFLRN